jgi:hypothetical protein
MALLAIRQRVRRLEGVFVVDRLADFQPLNHQEIEALVERIAGGEEWTREETARVARRCPYIEGELTITTGLQGEVIVKRYPGLDVAEI